MICLPLIHPLIHAHFTVLPPTDPIQLVSQCKLI
jgi:hypothetical protein